MEKLKTAKQMERHLKGMANHYRIEILFLVAAREGITLEGIVETLGVNEKTIGEHARRLFNAGLVDKNIAAGSSSINYRPTGKHLSGFWNHSATHNNILTNLLRPSEALREGRENVRMMVYLAERPCCFKKYLREEVMAMSMRELPNVKTVQFNASTRLKAYSEFMKWFRADQEISVVALSDDRHDDEPKFPYYLAVCYEVL